MIHYEGIIMYKKMRPNDLHVIEINFEKINFKFTFIQDQVLIKISFNKLRDHDYINLSIEKVDFFTPFFI